MVHFSTESRRFFMAIIAFDTCLNAIALLVALHNTIRYLCRPRSNKLLINLFYFFILTALISKITHAAYMMVERDNIFIGHGNDYEELFLYVCFLLEDCVFLAFILMMY